MSEPPDLDPVATDDRRAILTGSALWLTALLLLLTMGDQVVGEEHRWWRWVCVAGLVIGLGAASYLHTHHRWHRD